MLEAYILVWFGVVLAQASPGPNFLAVVGTGMSNGRWIGFFTLLGVSVGMLLWASLMAVGFGGLLATFPWLMIGMKMLGGGYLIWMAVRALMASVTGKNTVVGGQKIKLVSPRDAFLNGLLVLMTNPKAALMWAAVASFLFGNGLSAVQVAGFGPLAMISAFIIYGAYLMLFTTGAALRVYDRFARWVQLAFGAMFGLLGGRLLIDGIRELRQ